MFYLRKKKELQFEKEEVVYLSIIRIWIFKIILIMYLMMLMSCISWMLHKYIYGIL